MHSWEEWATKDTSNTKHVERVHKDIMFCLEYQHEVDVPEIPRGMPSDVATNTKEEMTND